MQATSILGRQHAQILGNQRLMLWYHLSGQRCAAFGQTQQIRTPILRMGLALNQAGTLHAIEQPDNVAFAYEHLVGQLLLEDVRRALELDQHLKLSRSQVIAFKLRGEAPFNFCEGTDQI